MPTNRRALQRERELPLSPTARAHLLGLEPPEDAPADEGLWLALGHDEALWARHGAALTAEWIAERPGTRPWGWWEWSAPRQPKGRYPGLWYDGTLVEPRRRVGGSGRPAWERFPAMVPTYWHGLPRYHHGTAMYESQATYLRRHGLLMPGEERRLTSADFEAEIVSV